MRFTSVKATNFKGRSFVLDLAPVTIVCGPNATGKSAVLEALSLAALGYVPGELKATKLGRDIYQLYGGTGPMSVTAVLDGTRDVTRSWAPQKGGSVRYDGPEGPSVPAECFDLSVFTGLTGPGRMAYMLRSLAGPQLSIEAVSLNLQAKLKQAVLSVNTTVTEQHLGELVEIISKSASTAAKSSMPVNEWLERISSELKERKLLLSQSVKRMQETLAGMTRAADQGPAPRPEAEALASAADKVYTDALQRRTELESALNTAREKHKELTAAAKLWAEAGPARAELEALEKLTSTDVQPASGGALAAAQDMRSSALVAYTRAETEFGRIEQLTKIGDKESVCPHCKQDTTHLKKAMAKQAKADLAAAVKVLDKCRAELAELTERVTVASAEHDKQQTLYTLYVVACRKADALRSKLRLVPQADPTLELDASVVAGSKLRLDLEQTTASTATLRAECIALGTEVKRLAAQRGEAAARARAEQQLEGDQAAYAAVVEAVELVAALSQEVVKRAVVPLLESVNKFCNGMLPGSVEFCDGDLAIGYTMRGTRSMSDSEKLVLAAGLAVALAAASPMKIATVGRFESFDTARRAILIERLIGMVKAGELNQALLVGVGSAVGYGIKTGDLAVVEIGGQTA